MSKNHINTHDSAGLTVLIRTVLKNDLVFLKKILEAEANPNLCDKYGNSPLIFAALNDRWEASLLLIDAGADPNLRDDLGNSPLIWAVRKNKFAVTQALLEGGSKINLSNRERKTALFFATENGCEEMVDFLIENGAKIDVKTSNHKEIISTLSPITCAKDHSINVEEIPKTTEIKYWNILTKLTLQELKEKDQKTKQQRPATAKESNQPQSTELTKKYSLPHLFNHTTERPNTATRKQSFSKFKTLSPNVRSGEK